MEQRTVEAQVSAAVDAWVRWLPRWRPGAHRGRLRPCRVCLGSPVVAAAGLAEDVPHPVQHALAMRMKHIVDDAVQDYTDANLPLLRRELADADRRKASRPYKPREGLAPEHEGLDLDPQPEPGAPFLFTLAGLERVTAAEQPPSPPPALDDEAKAALRAEIGLADEHANLTGSRVCGALREHRDRIRAAVERFVEPQVEALLAELTRELDVPPDPRSIL